MWTEFWVAVFVGALLVYLPGCLIGRGLGYSKIAACASAPITTLFLYCIIAIVYDKAGIWTNGWNLFVPVLALGLATYAIRVIRCARRKADGERENKTLKGRIRSSQYAYIGLYALVGVLAAIYAFSGNLSTPDCSSITYDDHTHLGAVRSFVETGCYSSLNVNYEYDLPIDAGGYYPAAWHLLAASIATICNVQVLVAVNASLFVCCAFFYATGCLYLVKTLFGNDKTMLFSGAFMSMAFVAFPWHFLVYGRLVSNLLAFALVPAMLACVIVLFGKGSSRGDRQRAFAIAFLGCCLSVFTQPNAVFTLIVFAGPYLIYRIWQIPARTSSKHAKAIRMLRVVVFSIVVVVFLAVCYSSPGFYGVTHFKWEAPVTVVQAVENVLLQGTWFGPFSPLLGLLVMGGCIFAACKRNDLRWVVAAFLIVSFMYVIDSGTNIRLKNYMTGFWYTDQHRISAMVAMISYPLAVFGLGSLCNQLTRRIESKMTSCIAKSLVIGLTTLIVFFPSFALPNGERVETAFGMHCRLLQDGYSTEMGDDQVIYSGNEREFTKKVAEITGDSLVYNIPMDGSMFAYQFEGVKTYYRYPFDLMDSVTDSRLLQRNLGGIADDPSVRRAADSLGVEYVMMLDYGHEPFHAMWGDFDSSHWEGVNSIDENTPGFELVLSEDDMRLYRIIPEGELAAQNSRQD